MSTRTLNSQGFLRQLQGSLLAVRKIGKFERERKINTGQTIVTRTALDISAHSPVRCPGAAEIIHPVHGWQP